MTQPVTEPPRCLRVEEAAQLLGIGRSLAYDLIRTGNLRSIKIGRRPLVPIAAISEAIAAFGNGGGQ